MNDATSKIYCYLLSMFQEKKLEVGDKLPTETALAKLFKVSRMNAHFAIKALEVEGYVTRNKRQGTRVRKVMDDQQLGELKNSLSNQVVVYSSPIRFYNVHWNERTMADLEKSLQKHDLSVSFRMFDEDHMDKLKSEIEELNQQGCYALVMISDFLENEKLKQNPEILSSYQGDVYFFNKGDIDVSEIPCHELAVDNFEEGMMAAKHLAEKGYETFLFISVDYGKPEPFCWLKERVNGITHYVTNYLKRKDDLQFLSLPEKDNELYQKTCDIIEKSQQKIGIIAQNDLCAAAFLGEARKQNLDTKTDFGLISFDNYFMVREYNITTIAPPVEKMGTVLGNMVGDTNWRVVDGMKMTIRLSSTLIERDT